MTLPSALLYTGPDAAEQFAADVRAELRRAQTMWPPHNSLHEAWAVMLEEMDEVDEAGADPLLATLLRARLERLWTLTKVNQRKRDPQAIYRELVQLAAMVARTAVDCGAQEFRK